MVLIPILDIVVGLVLLSGVIGLLPGVGKHLEKVAKWLGSFQGVIGIIAIIVGIWLWSSLLHSLTLIIGGIILAAGILETIPGFAKITKVLGSIQVVVGIIAIIIGILGLLP